MAKLERRVAELEERLLPPPVAPCWERYPSSGDPLPTYPVTTCESPCLEYELVRGKRDGSTTR